MENRSFRLIATCPDRVGIVAAVTGLIAHHGGWITEANQYSDPTSRMFFMRYVIAADSLPFEAEGLREVFAPLATEYAMRWRVTDTAVAPRVVILVSRLAHCLNDLLYRWRSRELHCEIPCVIANHEDLRAEVEWHGIPFVHVPVPVETPGKEQAFRVIRETVGAHHPDVIVLARFMQILPPWFCARYPNAIINIHHSFLPSFAGARPYHQAVDRGVKLTGATCHYVTEELDAGPIIEQDVVRISHHNSLEEIVRLGKDVEQTVLARGLRYHLEDRVLVHGNKTVVFG